MDKALLKDLKKARDDQKKWEAKNKKSVVCMHVGFPNLFGGSRLIHRIKAQENEKLDGKIFICDMCLPVLQNMNKETADKYFTTMREVEFSKHFQTFTKVIDG